MLKVYWLRFRNSPLTVTGSVIVLALVLLAFSAYARGDGPLAGVSLEEALRCDATHRMAPAYERLDTRDAARGHFDLRLIDKK